MANEDSNKPEKGDTMHVTLEFGPPKYYGTIPEKVRRGIGATDENLEYKKGEYTDKVVVTGELEVTDVYRKEL